MSASSVTALVNVTLVTLDDVKAVPRRTVLVRGDEIAAVGPVESVLVPTGARVVDGRGRYLMPGLADVHVHVQSESELLLLAAHGVTTIRDLFGMPYKLVWRDRIARGELLGPTLYTAGPILDGAPPNMAEMAVIAGPGQAERAVAEQKRRGYDFLKVYGGLSREDYDAIVLAARHHGLPIAGHVPDRVGLAHVLASKQASIEHLDGYSWAMQRGDSPYSSPAAASEGKETDENWLESIRFVDEAKIPRWVQATREALVWNCPTLVTYQKWGLSAAELTREAKRPELRWVHPILRRSWLPESQIDMQASDSLDEAKGDVRRMKERFAFHRRLTRSLFESGAGLALGTDAGTPFTIPGVSALEEAALLAESGVPTREVLRIATRNAAELLGASKVFGRIEPGQRADLLLLEEDPLRSLSALRRRAGVMLRGRWLWQSDLDARLDELAASYERPRTFSMSIPLPRTGVEAIWRFTLGSFGLARGEERVVATRRADGGLTLAAELVAVEPEEHFVSRLELGEGGTFKALEVDSWGREGRGNVRWDRHDREVRVRGHLPVVGAFENTVSLNGGGPSDALIKCPGILPMFALASRLGDLEVGSRLEVPVHEFDYGSSFALSRSSWTVERRADVQGEGGQGRVFAIEARRGFTLWKAALTLSSDGLPEAVDLELGEGTIRVRRAPVSQP